MATIQTLENNTEYQKILKDSFGGVLYNVANRGKYDTDEINDIVFRMDQHTKDMMDGIMKGVLHFINN